MSDTKLGVTLDNAKYPRAFLSLASAVLAALEEEGLSLLVSDEAGNVQRLPKDMITLIEPPVLLVDPSYILKYDEENRQITVSLDGCSLIQTRALMEPDHGKK